MSFIFFLLGVLTYILFSTGILTMEMIQSIGSDLFPLIAVYFMLNILVSVFRKVAKK